MKLNICWRCRRVVSIDNAAPHWVVLEEGEIMHADCYETWQDEIDNNKQKKLQE